MVDIIIPIYNGFDTLVPCIESVLKHTDLSINRLILINDKSPDERVNIYLTSLGYVATSNIIIIENETNLGFVKNVNLGMSMSRHDVLLLNSDTLVTKGWLEKIVTCANSDLQIATVTPFSNNASLCSTSTFTDMDDMPEGISVDEYGALIERVSLKMYPTIPVGVGFCMYIKRYVLDEIGDFDVATFAKGYGEECDFCYRAIEFGYRHVLCDDTFVWHKGNQSFTTKEKQEFIESHQQILNKRYPKQTTAAHHFIDYNPIYYLQNNINLALMVENGRPNILYLLHLDFKASGMNPTGGTQIHVKELVQFMRTDHNCYVLSYDRSDLLLSVYSDIGESEYRFHLEETTGFPLYHNKLYEENIRNILSAFKIELIHVHHVQNHTMDLFSCAEELGIPVIMTIHDFYAVCPKINLLNHKNEYCQDIRTPDMCEICFKNIFQGYHNSLEKWQGEFFEALRRCRLLIYPNVSGKNILLESYPEYRAKSIVVEHGMDIEVCNSRNLTVEDKAINIAFIGGLAPYKGSRLAIDLISNVRHTSIKWHIFGNIGDGLLESLEQDNLVKHGYYQRQDIVSLLVENNIHLVCIFSIWPETFCFTLSEAWAAGVPALVTDIGALGERMRKHGGGWLIDYRASWKHIWESINKILNDKYDYAEKQHAVSKIKIRNLVDMCLEYRNIYQEYYVPFKDNNLNGDRKFIYSAYQYADMRRPYISRGAGEIISNDVIQYSEMLNNQNQKIIQLEDQLATINNSFSFRIVRKLWSMRLPFRTQIKKLVLKIAVKMKG